MKQAELFKSFENNPDIKSSYHAGRNESYGNLTSQDVKDNLMGGLPSTEKGIWEGERGNSLWRPNLDYIPPGKGIYAYNNRYEKTWRQILQENHCENGIPFVNGEIDFGSADIVKAEIIIPRGIELYFDEDDMSNYNRFHLHEAAFNLLSVLLGVPVERVRRWKEVEMLVWHECCDLKTMQLVPREIHDNVTHQGGIALLKASRQSINNQISNL